MEKIEASKAIMDKAGVSDLNKLSKADKNAIIGNAEEAAYKVGLTVDTANKTVKDATGAVVFTIPQSKLVQTGANNMPYAILAGVAIIAVAGTVIYKKARA